MTASRIWTVGAVAVIAAILALGWFLGVAPLLAQAAAADAERAGVEAQTAAQRAQLELMKDDFERLDEILAELEPLQATIPDYEGVELFGAHVESVAAQHEIRLTSYVTTEMPFGGGLAEGDVAVAASGAGGPVLSTAAGTVYAIPLTIGFEGTPEAVTDAVRTLQEGSRLFLVQNVTFNRGSGGTPSATVAGYLFLLTDRALPATPDQAVTPPAGPNPNSYQVDHRKTGSAPAPAPTPDPAETPTP